MDAAAGAVVAVAWRIEIATLNARIAVSIAASAADLFASDDASISSLIAGNVLLTIVCRSGEVTVAPTAQT
ncbi:hypothetical protein QHI69_29095, partial [Burkholderia gladioli pv. gladioli]|uniref:hypothetical protein n=1 Tax=Burkholderia gladioli TaxID=28095 RepID=UPI0024BD219D